MAQITFTIPDAQVPRLLDALATLTGWTATIFDPVTKQQITNPVTKQQNANNAVISFMKNSIQEVELRQAKRTLDTTFSNIDVA